MNAQTKKRQTKRNTMSKGPSVLPLVVDVIGPMAFRWTGGKFELWMPDLTTEMNLKKSGITPHEAGIMTAVAGFELNNKDGSDYEITGPSGSQGIPPVHSQSGTEVYQAHVKEMGASNKYIYMLLPNPHCVNVLNPVRATISGSAPKTGIFATGVRLFYDQANKLELRYPDGRSVTILFDANCPLEKQTNMQIGYVPCDFRDPSHEHAKAEFHEVSLLCGLDLQVELDSEPFAPGQTIGRFRDCKAPVIGLAGS